MKPLDKVGLTAKDLDIVPDEYNRRVMHALTPHEGRYASYTDALRGITSEFQWVKRRLGVEIEYMIGMGDEFRNYEGGRKKLIERPFSDRGREALRSVYLDFSDADFMRIKRIEEKTDHDIVAMIIFGLYKMGNVINPEVMERAMHFGRTSEDIDGNVFSMMNQEILYDYYMPLMVGLQDMFIKKAREWHKTPDDYARPYTVIAAQTHEQYAVPTPMIKVMANIASAIDQCMSSFITSGDKGDAKYRLFGKLGGAVGNDSSMIAAYPAHNWPRFYKKFVESMGLEYQPVCDQDESNMRFLQLLDIYREISIPLLKWCDDYSSYLSRKVLKKKTRKADRGSSIMPQKVNPWRTEGAESMLEMANAELGVMKILGTQRKQGDLRRSILKRYMGIPMGNIGIALNRLMGDLKVTYPNYEGIERELNDHPEIAAASMQMIMRAAGVPGAYDMIVDKTKGKTLTPDMMTSIANELAGESVIDDDTGEAIISIFKPENNAGNAVSKANEQLEAANSTLDRLKGLYEI